MRIRKRKVPLPISLLSPIPLSDLHLLSQSPVMVVQTDAPTTSSSISITHDHHNCSQPSDCFNPTCSDLHRLIGDKSATTDVMEFKGVRTSNDDASNINSITTTKSGTAPAEDKNYNVFDQSLSYNIEGKWCDDEKEIPLKRRKGINFSNSFEKSSVGVVITEADKDASATMMSMKQHGLKIGQTKDNGKNNINNEDEEKQKQATQNNNSVSAKKGNSKRGNTIMEGSRCSRVNGRGWRCCQPTLVGYSLCEHHLGKGRLRNMQPSTSIKTKSWNNKKKRNFNNGLINNRALRRDNVKDLGVVKARSLSSLLGQTNPHE
ncbi:uncharacterized protein LOC130825746 isoform X1 [Amaranthus tricolor]|uniref:uncharacterized protein LOC130825746 isoform X1 n=1 Tax=Amaranthus tricolor TaxID=29722 RepID=UPI00258DA93A|nr:uncharacterized protein LOC130825746 isoform X1 [Amaranthus tricolor]